MCNYLRLIKLWAEAMHWACEAINHTACSANPDSKSPYEMWHGEASHARPYPFLKPAYCRWQRPSKLLPKGEACFYVGPSRDHPRDCHRVLTRVGAIQETRSVTWEALPSQLPPLQPSLLLIEVAEEGGEERDDDVEVAVWPLVGTGVHHVLLRRDVAVSGGIIDEVSSADAGSVGQLSSMPCSPAKNFPSNASPYVCAPAAEFTDEGGPETGEVESAGPGGQEVGSEDQEGLDK